VPVEEPLEDEGKAIEADGEVVREKEVAGALDLRMFTWRPRGGR
jgi:hypothetical protein